MIKKMSVQYFRFQIFQIFISNQFSIKPEMDGTKDFWKKKKTLINDGKILKQIQNF